ncbi:MerR family transcriptional regulator [Spongiactinospora rosea]|uniref:MerR family transcriptional regulator n=1 Tax=Spongiactinospora rosea TaxID=2248750 RepID=A0A366M3U8_9ACTN|nr:MerR family transcriptional regulator [Spongiactinospora rosea]RBQ20918.1 MerR family transcriptional regulator [Spongiactinospora rosea]
MTNARARRPRTVPTELAALAAGVTEATIRKWASRGKLRRYGTPGRAEYDLDEIFGIMHESRRRTGGH